MRMMCAHVSLDYMRIMGKDLEQPQQHGFDAMIYHIFQSTFNTIIAILFICIIMVENCVHSIYLLGHDWCCIFVVTL